MPEIRSIGVIGLGAMGAGIAQLAIEAGYATIGREVTDELGQAAAGKIGHFLTRKVEKGQLGQADRDAAVPPRRHLGARGARGLRSGDRGDVEELEPKRVLFAELDRLCRPDAILATNTSALSVTEIAAATTRPERVVGMHFFNPAPLMPLVEIVRAELTSDAAMDAAATVGSRLGKEVVRCHDTPGFVVNRVLLPLLNDCLRVLDEARVTPEALDIAMKNGAGWPMGPCTLVDLVGIDVHVHASRPVREAAGAPHGTPAAARGDEERRPARPQERPRLLYVRLRRRFQALFSLGRQAPGEDPQ